MGSLNGNSPWICAFLFRFFSVMYKLPSWLYRYALDLLQQTRSSAQGYAYNEYYLYDIHSGMRTRVRQPGLGNEAIAHLSIKLIPGQLAENEGVA
jgi:hypothetical protein